MKNYPLAKRKKITGLTPGFYLECIFSSFSRESDATNGCRDVGGIEGAGGVAALLVVTGCATTG
jgi:hypothetical protein